MTYTPNFNDPRVVKRINQALEFVNTWLKPNTPQWLGKHYINQHLGSSNRPLGQYLRDQLLTCVDEYYNFNTSKCKEYVVNETGVAFLRECLGIKHTTIHYTVAVLDKYQEQLASGQFEYKDSSDRLFHPIQNIRRTVKKQALAENGYVHTYDIQSCAPTLLLQYSQQQGMDLWLETINAYLKDRKTFRQQLAEECEISEVAVKKIINGLFQGAHISHRRNTSVFNELNGDHARIEFLKQHPFIIGLVRDIKIIWQYITPTLPLRTKVDCRGRTRRVPLSGKRKTALYRSLERSVLDSIELHLKQTHNQYFLEHDGWSCLRAIDEESLRDSVRLTTGFMIKLDYECLCNNTLQ